MSLKLINVWFMEIKKIQLIDENFSIENGLMTPTMKVKRKKVTEKYKDQLEKLY